MLTFLLELFYLGTEVFFPLGRLVQIISDEFDLFLQGVLSILCPALLPILQLFALVLEILQLEFKQLVVVGSFL